jgi:hypothetical protein
MIPLTGCGRDQSWPILRNYSGFYLEGYRKNMDNMNQCSRSTNGDLRADPTVSSNIVFSKKPASEVIKITHSGILSRITF